VVHDGETLPYARLASLLEQPARGEVRDARTLLIVRHDEGRIAVGVESVTGSHELVVRPLPWAAGKIEVVLGAALDLSGAPRLLLDARALGRAARRLGTGLPASGREPAPRPKKRPILVVDDSLTTRMLEQTILEMAGYEVDLATSGEEGLGMARARAYGLFVVDVEMPGMSGFDFTTATRADPRLQETPVILVTSLSSEADRRRGREAGAAAYVVKGQFHQGKFLETVAELSR
jgi:two-component system chemotaxis sensor kinase CheA